ncbi:MAG: DUF2142 domain-containing protein [Nostocales cyanobacterium W4_Combined_metabat2_030]|nr:DUF2142 domain-containing protein [Nostocales cyanobacterium W4_Combined_metabat2_030]
MSNGTILSPAVTVMAATSRLIDLQHARGASVYVPENAPTAGTYTGIALLVLESLHNLETERGACYTTVTELFEFIRQSAADITFEDLEYVLLSLSKLGSYFSLLLLFLLIPRSKFSSNKKYWGTFATILILNVAVVALWYSLVKHLNVPLNLKTGNVSTSEQLAYILNHPWQYLLITGKTFIVYGREYLEQFIGRLGWIDTRLPLPHLITYALLLVAVALGTNQPEIRLSWRQKSLVLLILIINSLFIATMLYLSWMPVGSQIIEGIQGRYFIPLGPLLFLLLYNQKTQLNLKIPPQILAAYSLFSCTLTAVVLLNRYYL